MLSNGSHQNVSASGDTSVPGQGWSNGALAPQLFPVTQQGRLQLYGSQRRWIGLQSGWTRIGAGQTELDAVHSRSQGTGILDRNDAEQAQAARSLIAQLCETFYRQGWATGTGGGVSIRVGGPSQNRPWRVFVAPSGIQKEDMIGDDVFELDMDRKVIVPPRTPNLRQSACTPLWYVVYKYRPTATCVIHTHSMHAQMATLLDPTETAQTLNVTHLEMLKGVGNHAYDDVLEIPIIDNRPSEDQLATQLQAAIQAYPKSNAVLVRRHGLYVWGDSWEQAKTQCESFDYLFQSAVQMKAMGIDSGLKPLQGTYREGEDKEDLVEKTVDEPPPKKLKTTGFHGLQAANNHRDVVANAVPILPRDAKILLLDIEGCTTSISFVKDRLFPYVRERLDSYLKGHVAASDKYQQLAKALAGEADAHSDSPVAGTIRQDVAGMVRYMMDRDFKSATLKALQGDIWKTGYARGELKGHIYSDFVPTCQWMQRHGVRVYIYSSGSVAAQKLLFGNSTEGDLLPYLSGHFDIPTAGPKKEAGSYTAIAQTLQVAPSAIVFCSDAEAELVAAREAGIGYPVMSVRPGNVPLSAEGRELPAIYSLLQLCGE